MTKTKQLTQAEKDERKAYRRKRLKQAWKMRSLYLLLIIPMAFIIVFNYAPMYGVVIAFKKYRYAYGILGSEWVGFQHFQNLFNDVLFTRAVKNTLTITLTRLFLTFPIPIIFAILLNELKSSKFKKVVQTISYLPHFLSWVIIGTLVYQMLSPQYGVVNAIITMFGGEPIYFMSKSEMFLPILILAGVWAGTGWGSILYLASMSSIDTELYESASLDGANRFQKAWYITLPGISAIVVIQFILSMSGIMSAGFDAVFNLSNGFTMDVADTLDFLSYRFGIEGARYDYAAALGLFQNVISLGLVIFTNKMASKISDYGIW